MPCGITTSCPCTLTVWFCVREGGVVGLVRPPALSACSCCRSLFCQSLCCLPTSVSLSPPQEDSIPISPSRSGSLQPAVLRIFERGDDLLVEVHEPPQFSADMAHMGGCSQFDRIGFGMAEKSYSAPTNIVLGPTVDFKSSAYLSLRRNSGRLPLGSSLKPLFRILSARAAVSRHEGSRQIQRPIQGCPAIQRLILHQTVWPSYRSTRISR